jgi:hypothetical protein
MAHLAAWLKLLLVLLMRQLGQMQQHGGEGLADPCRRRNQTPIMAGEARVNNWLRI